MESGNSLQPGEPRGELRKPHEMIVMVPTKGGRMTVTGRKIYIVMMSLSQKELEGMQAMPPANHMFEAPLNELLRSSGSSVNDRTDAKRYLREMRDLAVDWESTTPGNGVKWLGFSMVSEVMIELRNGENWVSWSFPPTIMTALKDPTRWARIDVDMIARLTTYAGIALYEICARYRDNPSGVTSRQSTAWWSDATSPDSVTGERREWRKIKYERIKPAIEEINDETDLEIELIEHKRGRAVVEVQFAIRRKKSGFVRRPEPKPVDAHLIVRGEALGIREAKMEGLIKEFGEDLVRAKVDVLEQRVQNNSLSKIESAYPYLRSLLRNHRQEDLVDAGEKDDGPEGASTTRNGEGAAAAAALPMLPKEELWAEERRKEMRQRIDGMSSEERKLLISEAVAYLKSKGMLTAVLMRRADQGDINYGMLHATAVRLLAAKVYGADWKKVPTDEAGGTA